MDGNQPANETYPLTLPPRSPRAQISVRIGRPENLPPIKTLLSRLVGAVGWHTHGLQGPQRPMPSCSRRLGHFMKCGFGNCARRQDEARHRCCCKPSSPRADVDRNSASRNRLTHGSGESHDVCESEHGRLQHFEDAVSSLRSQQPPACQRGCKRLQCEMRQVDSRAICSARLTVGSESRRARVVPVPNAGLWYQVSAAMGEDEGIGEAPGRGFSQQQGAAVA
jgi:hypothetical protein